MSEKILDIRNLPPNINLFDTGEVAILIHPFYLEHCLADLYDSAQQYTHSNRERDFLSERMGITLVFEDLNSYDSTKLRIITLSIPGLVIMIPTRRDNPQPLLLPSSSSEEDQWAEITKKLKVLGVTNFLLGGREFYRLKNGEVGGCVPLAARFLGPNFRVDYISSLCFPDQPLTPYG